MREMKDSNIFWLKKIPEKWEIVKGKFLYSIETGKLDANAEVPDGEYPFFTCSMYPKRINKYSFDCEALLVAGNGIVGFTQYYNGKFDAYQRTYILSNFKKINPNFLKYYVSNNLSIEVEPNSVGSVIQFIKLGDLQNFNVCIPPLIEQEKIVNFLDKKTIELNKVIEKTKETIEDYKKYKHSLITEIITNGLEKNKDSKESGIDWIGKVPENFDIYKIKYLGNARNGLTYSPENICDEEKGILVLRSSNIINGKISLLDNVYVNKEIKDELKIRKNDILICSRNGSRKLIGKNAIISEDIDATFGAFMMVFRSDKNPKYIKYILDSDIFNYYLATFLTSTINQLTYDNFSNMKVVYTSDMKQQEKIVNYLDKKCEKIDKLIYDKEKIIEELEEYKKSLIYEYVTGKKVIENVNYSAEDIAEWILNKNLENRKNGKENVGITNLKLQKLLYYATGIYFFYKKSNLIREDFVAWKHGPVIKEVYYRYNFYGAKEIKCNNNNKAKIDKETEKILEKMYSKYSQYTAEQLRNMTHNERPWKKTRRNKIIEKDLIKDYFENEYKWEQ